MESDCGRVFPRREKNPSSVHPTAREVHRRENLSRIRPLARLRAKVKGSPPICSRSVHRHGLDNYSAKENGESGSSTGTRSGVSRCGTKSMIKWSRGGGSLSRVGSFFARAKWVIAHIARRAYLLPFTLMGRARRDGNGKCYSELMGSLAERLEMGIRGPVGRTIDVHLRERNWRDWFAFLLTWL